ncbi:hypothetical protein Taro_023002 [Colocasia esculenta]|uniref:AIG1-type G domain-containing protein n=1 Tax=Colocasia esculenta TaxID=4460 RepID=A0A843VD46_COLES|nr:hypothetical protein [Colocasia esculenta]
MDSEAAPTTTLPPATAPSSPEDGEPKVASPPTSFSPAPQSGDDEPEFETAFERRLAAEEPEEEASPGDELDAPAVAEGSLPGSHTLDAPSPNLLPEEQIGVAEVGLSGDIDGVSDAEGSAPPPEVVGVEPSPPSPGVVDGVDGVLKEKGHGGDEKEAVVVETRSSSEDVGAIHGADSLEAIPGENTNLKVNPDELLDGVDKEEILLGSPVEEGVNKDGTADESQLAAVAAPSTVSSNSMGSGDGATARVEKNVPEESVEDKNVNLGDGNEEPTVPAAGTVGDSDAEKLQSIVEAKEKPAFDEESEKEGIFYSKSGGGNSGVAQVSAESNPEAEPQINTEERGGQAEKEEDKALVSSDVKGDVEDVEKEEVLRAVDVPVDSEETEHSVQKVNNLDDAVAVGEIVPSRPTNEEDGTEEVSAEPQVKSKEVEYMLDANDIDAFPVEASKLQSPPTEDPEIEQAGSKEDACVVSHVSDNGNVSVIPVPDSDMEDSEDGSEADAVEESKGANVGGGGKATTLMFDQPAEVATSENSEIAKRMIEELDGRSSGASSGLGSSRDHPEEVDGQIVSDSDEEVETDEDGEEKELLFDSAALTALLKAAASQSADGTINISGPDATRTFSTDRPAGLGSSASSLRPAPARTIRPNLLFPSDLAVAAEPEDTIDEEGKKLREMVENIRVKFLRLVHRLGHSPEDRVAAQVLYRLGLAEGIRHGRQIGRTFNLENAKKKALQLEEVGKESLDFTCNILVLGKTGVGKSATLNSIFGEQKVPTNAFKPMTPSVKEIIGTVDGIKIRVTDTPGLQPSVMDQTGNLRILASIKRYTKKCPPDIVLYVDRLDTQTWDFNDLPLLRSITSVLGSSIWFNAIVALTHAASAPPDGPSGSVLSYEVFVDQRSRIVQHAIRQAAGDMRLMNPVALVENHPSCRKNREGQSVLPNGLNWRSQLLLLCYSSKILSEANSLLKLQDPSPGKLFGFRMRSPPLPFLLSSLLQSRAHPKLPADQGGDNYDSDIDLGDLSDSDQEDEEDEYDQLPPFKPLRKAQIAKLTKEQRKAYFDEYDYRVKLLQKKQWKDEIRRLKEMKKMGKSGQNESGYSDMVDDYDQDSAPAAVPVPLPDMVLPPSFDCENPAYRYRFLEPTSQLLARPVLDTHGWDHDCGYDGVSFEENLGIAGRYPAAFTVQVTKDKKEFSIHLDSAVSVKHDGNGSSLAGFDIQTVGKQLAYIFRCESKFKNLKKNTTAAGISVTFLGESIATGLKVDDQLLIGKRVGLVVSSGAVRAQGDTAYGANLEVRLRDKDFPVGQDVSTLGLSLMRWRSDLALGANLQSQISIGRNSKMAVRVGLNNKLSGQITVRTSTSEHLNIALLGILPLAVSIYRSIWSGETN